MAVQTLYILDTDTGRLIHSYQLEAAPPTTTRGVVWAYHVLGWAAADVVVVATGTVPANGLNDLATRLSIKRFAGS
jgi:hypothetical protein